MDKEYLQKVFNSLGGNEKGWNFDEFSMRMSSDQDYNNKVFDRIGGVKNKWNKDDFDARVGLKKKEATTEEYQTPSELSSESTQDSSSDIQTSVDGTTPFDSTSNMPSVDDVIDNYNGELPTDVPVVGKPVEEAKDARAFGDYMSAAKEFRFKTKEDIKTEDKQNKLDIKERHNQNKQNALATEAQPTDFEDVFSNIADIQNKKLLGDNFKDLIPEQDPRNLSNTKILNDYGEYLKSNDPMDYQNYMDGKFNKGDKDSYEYMQKAISHQGLILEAKKDNKIIDEETYNNLTNQLKEKSLRAASVFPEQAEEYVKASIANKAEAGSEYYDFLYNKKLNDIEQDPKYSGFKAEVKAREEVQKEIDEDYEEALKNPYLPQSQSVITYHNVVAPAAAAFSKFGANVVGSALRLSGAAGDLTGEKDDFSRTLNNFADDMYDYFDSEKSTSAYKMPTELKGKLFEDGDMQWNRLIPKVSETMANMYTLVGGGSLVGGGVKAAGAGARTAQSVGLMTSSFVSAQNEYYNQAREEGMSHDESMAFSTSSAAVTSLLELINPQRYLLGGEGFKLTKDGLKAIIKNKTKGRAAKFVGKEILGENIQELSQEGGDMLNKFVFNKAVGSDFDITPDSDEIAELVVLTSIASGLTSTAGVKSSNELRNEALEYSASNPDKFNDFMKNERVAESLGDEKIKEIKKEAADFKKVYDLLPEDTKNRAAHASAEIDLRKLNEKKRELEAIQNQDIVRDKLRDVNSQISAIQKEFNITPEAEEGAVKKDDSVKSEGVDIKTKPVKIDNAPEKGTFINVGMFRGKTDEEITIEEIESSLPEGVEVINKERVEIGEGVEEPTMSMELSRPLTDQEMVAFRGATDQMAVPQLTDGQGVMTGTKEWGDFNPEFFIMPDKSKLSERKADTRKEGEPTIIKKQNVSKIDEISRRAKNEDQRELLGTIKNVVKALSGIDSNSEFVIHESNDSYSKAVREAEGVKEDSGEVDTTSGFYLDEGDGKGKIHINVSEGQTNTAFHEGSHKVMSAYLKSSPEKIKEFKAKLEEVLDAKTKESLDEFANEYDEESRDDEYVTEALARISDGSIKIDKTKMQSIIDFLKDIAKKLGLDSGKIKLTGEEDVVQFAQKLSDAFQTGAELDIVVSNAEVNSKAKPIPKSKYSKVLREANKERLPRHPNSKVIENFKLEDLDGITASSTLSDKLFTGKIGKHTVLGGIGYPEVTGRVWASGNRATANKMVNESEIAKDGYRYLIPAIMSDVSHMSNIDMTKISIDLIREAAKNNELSRTSFIADVAKTFSKKDLAKYKKQALQSVRGHDNVKDMIDSFESFMIGDAIGTFEKRRVILKSILGDGAKKHKYNTIESFSEVAKSLAEPNVAEAGMHQVVSVIRTKGDLSVLETNESDEFHHTSYPFAVVSKDKDGNDSVVETLYLDGAYNLVDIIPEFKNAEGKIVKLDEELKSKIGTKKGKTEWTEKLVKGNLGRTHGLSSYSAKIDAKDTITKKDLTNNGITEGMSVEPVKPVARFQKKAKKGQDLVDLYGSTSKGEMGSKMTKDSDGNYVLFHYAGDNFKGKKVNPKHFGKNSYTTDKRMHKVSFYYTNPLDRESMVGTESKVKAVKIAPDKVYPLQSDPLNYMDEAEVLFRKDFGDDAAFDPNWQASYIGKVALDNGFEMLVSDWGGAVETDNALRGESQVALPFNEGIPSDAVQAKTGEFIVKEEIDGEVGMDVEQEIIDWAKKEYEGEYNPFKQIGSWGAKEFFENNPELLSDIPKSIKNKISKPKFQKKKKKNKLIEALEKREASVKKRTSGTRRTKTDIDKTVDGKAKGEKKVVNTWAEFKRELREEEKNRKKGVSLEKARVREIRDRFVEIISSKSKELRATDASLSSTLLKKVGSLTEKNMSETVRLIDEALNRAENKKAENLSKAIQKKIPKASRKTPRNVKALGLAIKNINPRWVNPEELIDIANEYIKAVRGGGGLGNLTERVNEMLAEEEANYNEWMEDKLKEEYEMSDFKEFMSFEEFKEYVIGAYEVTEHDEKMDIEGGKSKARIKLERIIKWRLDEIQSKLDNSKGLSKKEIDTLNTILRINEDLSIDELSTAELKDLNNVISEIVTFDSYNSSGTIQAIVKGKIRAREIQKAGAIVEWSKFVDKNILGGHISSLVSFNNFFKAIAGGKGGKRLRNLLVSKLNEGSNQSARKSDLFNHKLDELYRKLPDGKRRTRAFNKIGMVSYVVQNESDMLEGEIPNDLEAKKELIKIQIQALRNQSKNKGIPGNKRKRYEEMADVQEEIYDKHIKHAKTKEDVLNSLNEAERDIYDAAVDEFAKIKDDLKDSHERFNGSEFIEFDNYIPTAQSKITSINNKDVTDLTQSSKGISNIDTKQSGTTIKRVKIPTKNADGTVNKGVTPESLSTLHIFDFNKLAKQKYKEALYDIHTLEERKVLGAVVSSKAVKEIFRSKELHGMLVDKLKTKIDMQKGTFQDGVNEASNMFRWFYKAVRYYKATKLKTVDQWIKQPASIIAHSAGQTGAAETTLAFKEIMKTYLNTESMEAFNKLLEKSEVANRVTMGEFIYKDQKSLIELAMKKGKVDKTIGGKLYLSVFDGALSNGDKFATRMTWLAAYMKEAKKNGSIKSLSDFDMIKAAENIDNDALHKADNTSQEINNISDYSDAPDMFLKGDNHLVREMLYTFRSFSVNMWINNAIALRDLVSSGDLSVDKTEQARLMAGSMMAVVVFQGAKQYIVNEAWDYALAGLFGFEDDDSEEEYEKKFKNTAQNAIIDYLIGGAVGGEFTEEGVKNVSNFLWEQFQDKKNGVRSRRGLRPGDKKTKDMPPFYTSGDYELPGSFGLPLEPLKGAYDIYKDYKDDGKFSKSSEYEALQVMFGLLGEGTVERLFSKAYRKQKKKEKASKKSRGSRR